MKNKGLEYINKRLPAEWERCGRILMSWPHIDTDWGDVIEEAREQFARLTAAFVSNGDKVLMLTANRQETMTFLMKCIALGREQFGLPKTEEHVWTHFIR